MNARLHTRGMIAASCEGTGATYHHPAARGFWPASSGGNSASHSKHFVDDQNIATHGCRETEHEAHLHSRAIGSQWLEELIPQIAKIADARQQHANFGGPHSMLHHDQQW
jgi:hypothetical protein